jgi:rod shape-determining protein MreD
MPLLRPPSPWIATGLLVPLLALASPGWLKLGGVAPSWAVLWLLPWSLQTGPAQGALTGAALGLLLDGLQPGPVSRLPALVLLGWWWGRRGRRPPPVERSFNLGLVALLGTLAIDLTLMLQWALLQGPVAFQPAPDPAQLSRPGWTPMALSDAGLHVLLARALLTALLAPVLCSLQLLIWRRRLPDGWHL